MRGTIIHAPGGVRSEQLPDLPACSDVMATGWYAAVAAEVGPGSSVEVVGDGVVGLCGVIAAATLAAAAAENTARATLSETTSR